MPFQMGGKMHTQTRPTAAPRIIGISFAIVPFWDYYASMRIISTSTIKSFGEGNPAFADAKEPALAWYRHALKADWDSPKSVKLDFGQASILQNGRVVFNIAGNKYSLVVWINYPYRMIYVRSFGTHKQYVKIDVQTI